MRAENLLDENFHATMMKKFVSKMWGIFSAIGNFITGMMGIYFCYTLLRMTLGQVVQMYNVYRLVGFTRDFILSWIPILGKHVLISNLRKRPEFWRNEESVKKTPLIEELPAIMPTSPTDDDKKGDGKNLYPEVHVAGMSTKRKQPTTNAFKVNGCSVSTLLDTGSCCTFVNISSFPSSTKFLNQIQDMRKTRVIRPSTSPWASPVLLVKKKNGTYRMCVDYRKLNAVTRKDVYPLPRIDDLLMRFGQSKIFSSFDLK